MSEPIVNIPAPMTTRDCLQVLYDLERYLRDRYGDDPANEVYGVACAIASEHAAEIPDVRLEQLRAALRAENISWGELSELENLADYIQPGDVELAEAAGIDEQEFAKR